MLWYRTTGPWLQLLAIPVVLVTVLMPLPLLVRFDGGWVRGAAKGETY